MSAKDTATCPMEDIAIGYSRLAYGCGVLFCVPFIALGVLALVAGVARGLGEDIAPQEIPFLAFGGIMGLIGTVAAVGFLRPLLVISPQLVLTSQGLRIFRDQPDGGRFIPWAALRSVQVVTLGGGKKGTADILHLAVAEAGGTEADVEVDLTGLARWPSTIADLIWRRAPGVKVMASGGGMVRTRKGS
jgi:hypothetical protein